MTKVQVELILDAAKYFFSLKKSMRDEVFHISKRSPKQELKHIIYLDANSLYCYTIFKFLPTGGFKWIDPKEFDLNKYTSNISKGCVL